MMQRLTRLMIAAALLLAITPATSRSQGTPIPYVQYQFLDSSGNPCSGCLLNAFVAGSTTSRQATYSTVTLTLGTENANPIVLDSAGRPTSGYIYLSATSYRFVLTDSTGGTTYWEADNTPAIPGIGANIDIPSQIAGEALTAGDVVYLSDGSGALVAGRWYKADSDFAYASNQAGMVGIVPAAIASGASGSIRIGGRATGLTGLTSGTIYYVSSTAGALTATAPGLPRLVGTAVTSTTLVFNNTAPPQMRLVLSKTTTYALLTTDGEDVVVKADATSAGFTVSLYTAVGNTGRRLTVIKTDTSANIVTLDPNSTETINGILTAALTSPYQIITLESDGTNWQVIGRAPPTFMGAEGRLTGTTNTCITTVDVTSTQTIYYTPCRGTRIALYDGTASWNVRTFAEIAISISTCTASKPYDVFLFDNAGVVTAETLVWTNDTTRATAVVRQDGVWVKTGATTRRYVGTFYCNSAGARTDDSFAKRNIFNADNREPRILRRLETTASWTYTTASFHQANAAIANQVEVMIGLPEVKLDLTVRALSRNSAATASAIDMIVAIGEDSTSTAMTGLVYGVTEPSINDRFVEPSAIVKAYPPLGHHFYAWLEQSTATGTTTWLGTSLPNGAGLSGETAY